MGGAPLIGDEGATGWAATLMQAQLPEPMAESGKDVLHQQAESVPSDFFCKGGFLKMSRSRAETLSELCMSWLCRDSRGRTG